MASKMFSLFDVIPEIPQLLIIDVGASILEGHEDHNYLDLVKSGKATVIGFEPNEEECKKINKKYSKKNKFYPHFIGKGGKEIFYETNWFATGSLLKPNKKVLETFQQLSDLVDLQKEHPVVTKTLDDFPKALDADYLKIDVQGAELDVFKSSPKTMANISVIDTEVEFVELYENQPLFGDVDVHLRSIGFQFHCFEKKVARRCFKPVIINNDVSRGLLQHLWADAVYVRDFMKLDLLSESKLLKMAAIMHDIYNSFDICCHILTEYDRKTGESTATDYLKKLTSHTYNLD